MVEVCAANLAHSSFRVVTPVLPVQVAPVFIGREGWSHSIPEAARPMLHELQIRIAGISARAWTVQPLVRLHCPEPDSRFLVDEAPADLDIEVQVGDLPDTGSAPLLFQGREVWSLVGDDRSLYLRYGNAREGIEFDRVLHLLPDRTGLLTVLPEPDLPPEAPQTIAPFAFPGLEVLLYREAAVRGGVFFHGSGLEFEGSGCLFCGLSGAGKSTISGLLRDAGARILNDDRVGMMPGPTGPVLHGTPWHGTARYHTPDSVPLGAIFFIEHGDRNRLSRLGQIEASARLVAAGCPPYYSSELMQRAVAACEDAAARVPAYRLAFVPEPSVVDVVREAVVS